jgi:hypothetical protein
MTCPHPEKHRHASFRAALKARDELESDKGIDLGLRPYRCDDHWHLGHKSKPTAERWLAGMARRRKAASR